MTLSTNSARDALSSKLSVSRDIWPSGSISSSRIFSPSVVPPGSRVKTKGMVVPESASWSSLIWVDLPAPSMPSKVTKSPPAIEPPP
jgi:hypothetical protein